MWLLTASAGCADVPVTPDQLQADGQLLPQAPFSARGGDAVPQRAAQISAVLADAPSGALVDTTVFAADVGTVFLHLRADGLAAERPVVFRWTRDGEPGELVPGLLTPSPTLRQAGSFAIDPARTGAWTVEILADTADDAAVLWQRRFEVVAPDGSLP